MTTFTDIQAKQQFADVLEQACAQGEVRIKRADGQEFIVRPAAPSSLNITPVQLDPPLTADEIVRFVREGRERGRE
jgi:hypothetical protein